MLPADPSSEVLQQNAKMLGVFHKGGTRVQSELKDGVWHIEIPFAEPEE